jgi:hypothetical protein
MKIAIVAKLTLVEEITVKRKQKHAIFKCAAAGVEWGGRAADTVANALWAVRMSQA